MNVVGDLYRGSFKALKKEIEVLGNEKISYSCIGRISIDKIIDILKLPIETKQSLFNLRWYKIWE